jgi:hypothetical protein
MTLVSSRDLAQKLIGAGAGGRVKNAFAWRHAVDQPRNGGRFADAPRGFKVATSSKEARPQNIPKGSLDG